MTVYTEKVSKIGVFSCTKNKALQIEKYLYKRGRFMALPSNPDPGNWPHPIDPERGNDPLDPTEQAEEIIRKIGLVNEELDSENFAKELPKLLSDLKRLVTTYPDSFSKEFKEQLNHFHIDSRSTVNKGLALLQQALHEEH